MDKQTTIAFILIGVILVVWLYFNAPEPQEPQQQTVDSTIVEDSAALEEVVQPPAAMDLTQTDATDISQDPSFKSSSKPEEVITIENDLAILELTTKGARIKKYYLKNYNTWYYPDLPEDSPFYKKYVQLINYTNDGGDFNLVFVTKEGKFVNSNELDFEADAQYYNYTISGNDQLKISFIHMTDEGKSIQKIFTFYGNDYLSDVDIILNNMQDVISSRRYDIEWSNGINFVEENSVDEANYSNASAYSGEEQLIIDASSIGEKVEKSISGKVDWVGVRNKYFGVIIAQDNPDADGGANFIGEKVAIPGIGEREYYSAGIQIPFEERNYQKNSFKLYIGPLEYYTLKDYDRNFQAIFDFGSFLGLKFITRPISEFILLPLFTFLHSFIPNYGFVILVFSLIIKLVLYPLTRQSYLSMRKVSKLQPKIAELKQKYKDDPQRVQKETMKMYQTYGVNPAGGCLPMLLQMPILFALFSFFGVAIEIRQQPFILWITNLSSPDIIYSLPFKIPLFGIDKVTGLAPLLGISMFLQQKMSVKDPSQKAMVYMMPFMFTFLFMGFASGLNLYYFMFNVLSIAQQYYINHKKGDGELVPVKNPKKKAGFMQRMMAAAEQQKKAQKKGR